MEFNGKKVIVGPECLGALAQTDHTTPALLSPYGFCHPRHFNYIRLTTIWSHEGRDVSRSDASAPLWCVSNIHMCMRIQGHPPSLSAGVSFRAYVCSSCKLMSWDITCGSVANYRVDLDPESRTRVHLSCVQNIVGCAFAIEASHNSDLPERFRWLTLTRGLYSCWKRCPDKI